MKCTLEAFAIGEELSGRYVDYKHKHIEERGLTIKYYNIRFPEIAKLEMSSSVTFLKSNIIMNTFKNYEITKLKHIIDNKMSDFLPNARVQTITAKNDQSRIFYSINIGISRSKSVVDFWQELFNYLTDDSYLEKIIEEEQSKIEQLKALGAYW